MSDGGTPVRSQRWDDLNLEQRQATVLREFAAWRRKQEEKVRREWRQAHPLGCPCETCAGHRDRLGRNEDAQYAGAYLAGLAEGERLESEFRAKGGYGDVSLLLDEAQRALRDRLMREHAARLVDTPQLEPDRS